MLWVLLHPLPIDVQAVRSLQQENSIWKSRHSFHLAILLLRKFLSFQYNSANCVITFSAHSTLNRCIFLVSYPLYSISYYYYYYYYYYYCYCYYYYECRRRRNCLTILTEMEEVALTLTSSSLPFGWVTCYLAIYHHQSLSCHLSIFHEQCRT